MALMVAVLHVEMPLGFAKNTLLILQELQYLFLSILSAIALFVFLVKSQSCLKILAPLGRASSSNIYFYHVACKYVFNCFSASLLAAILLLVINKIRNVWN